MNAGVMRRVARWALRSSGLVLLASLGVALPQLASSDGTLLLPPNGAPGIPAHYGRTVLLDGRFLAVGGPIYYDPTTGAGRIAIYERAQSGWVLSQQIDPPNGVVGQQFGGAMASVGDWLIVGSSRYTPPGTGQTYAGRVDIYRRVSGTYQHVQTLEPPDPQPIGGGFGYALAVEGQRLCIGRPADSLVGQHYGSIYFYELHGNHWVWSAKVDNPAPQISGSMGSVIAMDGDVVAVAGSNGVLVFERTQSGAWAFLQDVQRPVNGPPDFGDPLLLEGGDLYVGHPRFGIFPLGLPGRVEVFTRTGGMFQFSYAIQSPAPTGGLGSDSFGRAFDFDGDQLAVSATSVWHPNLQVHRGVVYLYSRIGGQWVLQQQLSQAQMTVEEGFGTSVALQADVVAIGAKFAVNNGTDNGGAYVFDRYLGDRICSGAVNSTGFGAGLELLGSLSATAGALELEAHRVPAGGAVLFALALNGRVPTPVAGSQGQICLGTPAARLGVALADSGGRAHFDVANGSGFGTLLPSGPMIGQSIYFQAWYRDTNPTPTFNFSDALEVRVEFE